MGSRLSPKDRHARVIKGPDGLDCLIAIEGWYWNALDWLTANNYWEPNDYYNVAWGLALEVEKAQGRGADGFQGIFARSLQGVIWVKWTETMNQIDGISNDSLGAKTDIPEIAPQDWHTARNFFDLLSAASPQCEMLAEAIAHDLVIDNPETINKYLDRHAIEYITACLLYMTRYLPRSYRTIEKLKEMVMEGDKDLYNGFLKKCLKRNKSFVPRSNEKFDLFLRAMSDTTAFGGRLQKSEKQFRLQSGPRQKAIRDHAFLCLERLTQGESSSEVGNK